MKLAMIGLGKMGYNLAVNLIDHEHEVVAYDVDMDVVDKIVGEGAIKATSLEEAVQQLTSPRVIWLMIPAGDITENVLSSLESLLKKEISS